MMTSSSEGAHRIHTVRATGSSSALSSASAARSVSRSASSMMITRHGRPTAGAPPGPTRSRACSTRIDRPSVARTVDVGVGAVDRGAALAALRRSRPAGHSSAAAKARAATERPDPGGPVSSQAWVIAAGSATARCSVSTALSWPMTSAQTLTTPAPSSAATPLAHGGVDVLAGAVGRQRRGSAAGSRAARSRKCRRTPSWKSSGSDSSRSCTSPRRDAPVSGGTSSDHGEVGQQPVESPTATGPRTSSAPEVAPGALVGDRGVEVAVGEDDVAALERRADERRRRGGPGRRRTAAPRPAARRGRRAGPGRARAARTACRPARG